MKKTTIIISAFLFILAASNIAIANDTVNIKTAWPEAVIFSKQQMTRLDEKDPSYEHKLKGIQRNSFGVFYKWEKFIKSQLEV